MTKIDLTFAKSEGVIHTQHTIDMVNRDGVFPFNFHIHSILLQIACDIVIFFLMFCGVVSPSKSHLEK